MPRNLLNVGLTGRNLLNVGDGVTDVVGGDAISVVETDNQIHTVNLDISKQGAASSLADTDVVALETSGGVIQKITGANLKTSAFSSNWTRGSGNIFPTVTGDTIVANDKIQINTLADGTYLDNLLLQNTNAGTDILTYKYQIKDNGSLDAKLNFKVDYSRGGGTSIDIFEATYDGFLQIKKRLDVANGFFANSGEEYNFLATGGTLANTSFFSGTSPITYNSTTGAIGTSFTLASLSATSPIAYNSTTGVISTSFTLASLSATAPIAYNDTTGVISTAFTATSTDNMSGKTFQDQTLFNRSLQVKNGGGGETNVSGSVRFFEAGNNGSFYTDLHTGGSTHQLTDNRNVYLPDATGTVVLEETNIWKTQGSNIITPVDTSLTAIDLPNNCSIRNDAQDTQFIKFTHTSSTNETIQLASNQVSIENKLVAEVNDAYYLKFGNGTLDSTFTNIDLTLNSKIRSASNASNFIGIENDAIYVNTQIDLVQNGSIRNDSDPTNDFVSWRDGHLYINYALVEIIQGGKIANGSDPTNDYIQFNDNELYINYAVVDVKQATIFQNATNNLSAFAFESDRIKYLGPVLILSDYGVHSTTRYPLEVEGFFTAPDTTGTALYYQDVPSLGGRAIAINGDVNMSAKFEYGLYVETGQELWVASDERIKKDIEPFTNGLNLLRQLEVKSYKYIDGRGKEPKHNEIGFIAQEVKAIYPKAITLNHEYIPNVYKKITCEWTASNEKFKMKTTDLPDVINIDYKFFCWNEGDKIETKVTAVGNTDNTFTFDKKWENVFCIGNRVNDFNTLDKSSLYVINFSATKELDNIVKQQQVEIDELKSEMATLKALVNKLISSQSK